MSAPLPSIVRSGTELTLMLNIDDMKIIFLNKMMLIIILKTFFDFGDLLPLTNINYEIVICALAIFAIIRSDNYIIIALRNIHILFITSFIYFK